MRQDLAISIASALWALFVVDRGWKFISMIRFFGRQNALLGQTPLDGPERWPALSLIQPITRGASGLEDNLRARLGLEYCGAIQHLLVCDRLDLESQRICRRVFSTPGPQDFDILCVDAPGGVASKIVKMQAGVGQATGDILCFIDDDVAPRPDNLERFLHNLSEPNVGAVFGLACCTNWNGVGTAMMSAFVNANALYSYIPLAELTPPFTITGHFFAVHRDIWLRSGGLHGLHADRADDDHEIARRIRRVGSAIRQTAAVYDVNNSLPSLADYNRQMKRWSVFMRRWCWPYLTLRERIASLLPMLGSLLLTPMLLLAIAAPGSVTRVMILGALLITFKMHAFVEGNFYRRYMPAKGWLYFLWALLITPYHLLLSPLFDDVIEWRGQRMRVLPGGLVERLK